MGWGQAPWIATEMCFSPRQKSRLLRLKDRWHLSVCLPARLQARLSPETCPKPKGIEEPSKPTAQLPAPVGDTLFAEPVISPRWAAGRVLATLT